MSVMWGCATVVCQTARSQIKFVYGTSTTQPFGPEIEMNECKVPQRSAASSHSLCNSKSKPHLCIAAGRNPCRMSFSGPMPEKCEDTRLLDINAESCQDDVQVKLGHIIWWLLNPTQATLNNIHIQWQHVILRHWCLDLLKSQHFHQRCEGKSRPFKSSCKCAAVSTTTRTMLVVHWQWAKNHRQTEV